MHWFGRPRDEIHIVRAPGQSIFFLPGCLAMCFVGHGVWATRTSPRARSGSVCLACLSLAHAAQA